VFVILITNFGKPKITAVYNDQSIFHKELYEAPSTCVVDVRFEGIICLSPGGLDGTRNGYGDAIEGDFWIWS
jgi:hypothetical protein